MSTLVLKRIAVSVAALTAVAASVPTAAQAAPSRGSLSPYTEVSSDTGWHVGRPTRAGEVSRGVIGFRNTGLREVRGMVVEMHLNAEELKFARLYENCWYSNAEWYAQGERPGTAWCEFPDRVAEGSVWQLHGPVYSVLPDAEPGVRIHEVNFAWGTAEWAAANGGIEALATADAEGAGVVRGTQGTLSLEAGSPRLRHGPGEVGALPTYVLPASGAAVPDLPALAPADDITTGWVSAMTEPHPDELADQGPTYRIGPDTVLPGTIGVMVGGEGPVDGVVVELRLSDTDLSFVELHKNCWYALEGKPGSAWCQFDDLLEANAVRKIVGPVVTTGSTARADINKDVRFHWVSKKWATMHGGVESLAQADAAPGTKAVRGSAGPLTLGEAPYDVRGHLRGSTDFILALWPPAAGGPGSPTPTPTTAAPTPAPTATTSPAATASPTATVTATTSPTAAGGVDDDDTSGGGGGGETLPITGSPVAATASTGAAFVLVGVLALVLTRQRRTGDEV